MGSLALADECAKQDEVLFVLSGGEEAFAAITEKGYRWHAATTWEAEQQIFRQFQPDVIVVNKLNSPPEYIRSLKACAGTVVTIDDAGDGGQHADLRINPLYYAPAALNDPQYITLRREFQVVHCRAKVIHNEPRELLITQGGSDTHGFTPHIIRALESMKIRPHCTVVIGPAFKHEAELRSATETSSLDLTVARNARNMAELMWKADLAITAGGLTMFELACVGTPAVVVCAEPFEVETASRLEKAGAVVNLGFGSDLNGMEIAKSVDALASEAPTRTRMSERGRQLVDGRGCERIVGLIGGHAKASSRSIS